MLPSPTATTDPTGRNRVASAGRPWRSRTLATTLAVVVASVAALSGCGAALPVLQPASVLPAGQVEAGAGVTGQFALGKVDEEIAAGRELGAVGSAPDRQDELLAASFLNASLAPRLSPWVAAAVGLGGGNEGGLQYTGRSLRVGFRHAWQWDAVALSLGAGAASVVTRRDQPETDDTSADGLTSDGVDWYARGFGADLPITVGWQSRGRIVAVWAGARVGFESLDGGLPFVLGTTVEDAPAEVRHWFGSGLLGASIGGPPLWVRVELDATYHDVDGEAVLDWSDAEQQSLNVRATGLTISPAAAIIVEF